MRRLTRQTDSGSDNIGWVTFALHAVLVSEGVFDCIDWLRIMAGHSHNEADANHRRALQVFYPNKYIGHGCDSPLEFETRLNDGLKNMNGGFEMMWQLANFDFEAWMQGCVSPEFGMYKKTGIQDGQLQDTRHFRHPPRAAHPTCLTK